MEIYILNGVEVTLDQLQGAARAAGIPLEEFKVLNNVTLKPTEPDQEIQAEEDFQTGVADEDAYVAPEKYPGASELELKLEELSSDLQSLRSSKKYSEIAAKQTELDRARYDLQNIYDAAVLDFDEPRTVLRKGEDEVKTKLKEKYPWLVTKTTGIGNALKVQLPDGTVTLDLDDGFMSHSAKQESVDILNKIKNLDKALTGNQKSEINLGTALDQAVADKDMSNVNTLLEGTGYEVVQDVDTITERLPSDGFGPAQTIELKNYNYSLLKDGEAQDLKDVEDIKKFLAKDTKVFDAITDNAYQAQKEFVLEFNKKLEEEKNVIQTDKQTPLKYYQEQFKKDLERILGDKITASDKGELYTHFQTIKAASLGNKRKGVEGISVDEQVARYKNLSGLSEELRTKLIESGVSLKDITNKGINDLTLEELGNRSSTIAESIIKENGNQKLINLSQRFIAEDEKTFNTEVANRVEETKKVYDSISSTFAKRAQSIINQAPEGTKITIGYIGGKPQLKIENERVLTEKENREVNRAANQMLDLQFSMSTLQSDYAATLNNINLDIEQYYVNKGGVDENTFNTANKEYNIGSLLAKDINDSFASLLLTVPTLLGSDFAIEEQRRLNKKNEYYETMLAYDDGDFLRYALRTTAQQSANLTLAIATAGGGSALGLTTGMTQAAVGSVFGLTSGTQTYRDLTLGKTDIVKEAKLQRDKLESAYREGIIGQYEYSKMMEDVNNTIAMNDLKPNQIIQASVANGLIEGTITGIIGTAPNSIKLLKDFKGASQIKNIANNIFKGNTTQLINYIGKPLILRPAGEVLEETSIYGLQQYVTEYGLLDRELDLSQLDDTAVSAIVVSGVSQSPGIAYGGILTYGKTKKFEKAVNKLQVNNQNLSKLIQNR